MNKRKDCQHQHPFEPECQPALRVQYECACGAEWSDVWSCACDDNCPDCGTTVEASDSDEIAPCACKELGR
jgi:hypothetical protein